MWVDGLLTVMIGDIGFAGAAELEDGLAEIRTSGNARNAGLIPVFGPLVPSPPPQPRAEPGKCL